MEKATRENFSRKRTAILKALQETDSHPTADWVYEQLKPRYPNLSLGTVYRNLKKLCDTGKIRSVGVINGQEHFDAMIEPHSHFICEHCGDIHNIEGDFFSDKHLSDLSVKHNHLLQEVEIRFKGICNSCVELLDGQEDGEVGNLELA